MGGFQISLLYVAETHNRQRNKRQLRATPFDSSSCYDAAGGSNRAEADAAVENRPLLHLRASGEVLLLVTGHIRV